MRFCSACRVEYRNLLGYVGDCLLDADKIRSDDHSKIGQANSRLTPFEELSAKFVLQLLDRAGEGRLCDAAALARAREATFLIEREKRTNLMNFHRWAP